MQEGVVEGIISQDNKTKQTTKQNPEQTPHSMNGQAAPPLAPGLPFEITMPSFLPE